MLSDLRYSFRTLWASPVFTGAALLCLTLAIAANTTIFSVFDALVLRPLPFTHPEQLASLAKRDPTTGRRASLTFPEYLAWRQQGRSFSALGAHAGRTLSITEAREPERVSGRLVSATLFPLLGARAQLGRLFDADDDQMGAGRVALVGEALWRRRYGGDSSVIGRRISLDNTSYQIVGVMERGFAYPSQSEIWLPITPFQVRTVSVVARLGARVSIGQASEEAKSIGRQVARQVLAKDTWVGDVRSLRGSALGSDEALVATAMLGATTFLLLIACANVANLMLTRATAREREIAVRAALGASRQRIVAQLVMEAMLIALTASILALPLTWEALRRLAGAIPPSDPFPYYMQWSLDTKTFIYTAVAAVLTGLVFGVGPAIHATSGPLHAPLKQGGHGASAGPGRHTLRNALVAAEVALAVVLLVGASLFVRTFIGLRRTELGFDARRVMTMRFYLPGAQYDSTRSRDQVVSEVLRRVEASPGVDAATISDLVPLDDEGGSSSEALAEGAEQKNARAVAYSGVAGRWFDTFGMTFVDGRSFTPQELSSASHVAVINKAMAATFWAGGSAIGRRFRLADDSSRTWYTVVGVVPDIRTVKLDEDMRTPPTAYLPMAAIPTRDYGLMVRTKQSPASLTPVLRNAIHAVDPVLPVFNVWTMEHVRYLSFWMYALWGTMFAVFGGIALLLATIGVYAVIHYGVAQRTREIGVRVALGARRADVIRLVLGQGMKWAAIGGAVGLAGALALTQVVESLLIGVSPTDPISFAGVIGMLVFVAGLASYLPAQRAASVDPLVALRQE